MINNILNYNIYTVFIIKRIKIIRHPNDDRYIYYTVAYMHILHSTAYYYILCMFHSSIALL